MDKVWIVLRNGKIDAVFNTEASAFHHQKQLQKKWNVAEVVCHEVRLI